MGIEVTDSEWMLHALGLAQRAAQQSEVPIGAVVVRNGELVGEGWNQPILSHDPTAHAEIQALRAAAENVNNYRLPESTLYVTLEPCLMCLGAIVHARVARVVFGCRDPKVGTTDKLEELFKSGQFNHRPEIVGGVCEDEAALMIKSFFKARRN